MAPEIQHYEDLRGETGRQVFFRAPRLKARDLFDLDLPLTQVDGASCRLIDLSMSGLAAVYESDDWERFPVGTVFPVNLRQADVALHEGQGRIVRVEPTFRGLKLAVQLIDTAADLNQIRTLYRESSLRTRLLEAAQPERADVDPRYRALCADVLTTLRSLRETLAAGDGLPRERRRAFLDECEKQVWPVWAELCERGNRLVWSLAGNCRQHEATKAVTQLVLTPEFMGAPIWRRSAEKPMGYPGDYMLMDYVYDRADEGLTLYDQLIHRLGVRSCQVIETRMQAVLNILWEEFRLHSGAEPYRVLNLGCGAAREVALFLEAGTPETAIDFTLIDQDSRALATAYERAYPHVLRHAGQSNLRCLQTSFARLIQGGDVPDTLPSMNFIYSIGLTDYLQNRRGQALIEALYEKLAPGGVLIIGNLKHCSRSNEWISEMICDWTMVYRTERDMLSLAQNLKFAEITLTTEPLDRVYLLKIRKRGS